VGTRADLNGCGQVALRLQFAAQKVSPFLVERRQGESLDEPAGIPEQTRQM
jgi:hypothetical protein